MLFLRTVIFSGVLWFFLLAPRKTLALPTTFLCPGKDHDIRPQNQGCGLIYSILPSFLCLFLNINCVGTGAGAVCAPEAAKSNGSSQVKNKKVGFKSLSERAAGFPMALTSQRVWWMFPLFVLWPRKSTIEIQANPMISSPWLLRSERSWDYLSWFIIPWATSKARPCLWRAPLTLLRDVKHTQFINNSLPSSLQYTVGKINYEELQFSTQNSTREPWKQFTSCFLIWSLTENLSSGFGVSQSSLQIKAGVVVVEGGRAGNRCVCGVSVWATGWAQGPLMKVWDNSLIGVN